MILSPERYSLSTLIAAVPALFSLLLLTCSGIPRMEVSVEGQDRSYFVRLPYEKQPAPEKKYPLIIQLHGGGGNAEYAESISQMTGIANERGYIVAYPDGSGPRISRALKTWNAGQCCGKSMRDNVDDVAFLTGFIDHLIANYPVDPNRIYLCGFSNGGMMTYRAARTLAPRLAAIAVVSGAMFGEETIPESPLPVMIIHGTADDTVPFEGGESEMDVVQNNMKGEFASVQFAATFWARNNGCGLTYRSVSLPEGPTFQKWTFPCPARSPVTVLALVDEGHAWPGGTSGRRNGPKPTTKLSASRVILDFFDQNRN
ncbi:MAG: polyhydroxybutyrate depolymerase [Leptospiraceae bacterium]|nr:polyhydroxybutyrate depolymerase [Leptospiraceae bacterium]